MVKQAEVAILNVDDDRLSELADALPIRVIRVSGGARPAEVVLRRDGEELVLEIEGDTMGRVEQPHAFASNAAAAVAAATISPSASP